MKSSNNPEFIIYDKKAYSGGFESIYTLENVDLKTVRKVSQDVAKTAQPSRKIKIVKTYDLFLDFGLAHKNVIKSFVLDQPISVLQLSLQAEKKLQEASIKDIRSIIELKEANFTTYSLGAGHIDEILQKLNEYLEGKDLFETDKIDFVSLLRVILSGIDGKKLFALLQPFRLAEYFTISPSDRMQSKHLVLQKKDFLQEAILDAKKEERVNYLMQALKNIYEAFLYPWVLKRGGVVSVDELSERLEKCCENPFSMAYQFIKEIYFNDELPFKHFLVNLEKDCFAISQEIALQYHDVIQLAKSYFYKEHLFYHLDEIVLYLTSEMSKSWKSVEPKWIENVLKKSPSFSVKQNILYLL